MAIKPESRKRIPLSMIGGGLNDTSSRYNRSPSQAKTMSNCRITPSGTLKKVLGRSLITNTLAGSVTGLICAPHTLNVTTLNVLNKTLMILWNGVAKTVTLAEGGYASYTDLKTALQTAINTATATSGVITVTYDTTTRLYTIAVADTAHGGYTLILQWDLATTTLDKSLFGFYHTISIAQNTNKTSDYALGFEKQSNIMFGCSDGRLYTSGKVNVTLPDTYGLIDAGLSNANGKWSGFYHLDKWYGTNQAKSFIIRDKYIRMNPDESKVGVSGDLKVAAATNFYVQAIDGGTDTAMELKSPVNGMVLPCWLHAGPANNVYALDKFIIDCKRIDAAKDNWVVDVIWQPYASSRQYLLDRIRPSDFADTNQHTITINIGNTNTTEPGAVGYSVPALGDLALAGYIILKYSKGTEGFAIYTKDGSSTYGHSTIDDNGVWQAGTVNAIATLTASALALNSASSCEHRITLKNKDGFETKPTNSLSRFKAASAKQLELQINVTKLARYDVDTVVVYRSQCGNLNNFYKVCEIPVEMFSSSGTVVLFEGVSDTNLAYRPEADLINQWVCMPASAKVVKWDNRAFIIGSDATGFIYYSEADKPEKFNLATQYLAIGTDGSNIVDCVPYADRMMVLKNNSISMLYPITSGYGVQPVADNAIGSVSAFGAISITSGQGAGIYFQAGDGHIYFSNGIQIKRLTGSKLDNYVDALNKSYFHKTAVVYDDYKKELIWSVCTGENTSPNANMVYQILFDSWYLDTMPAEVWDWDYTSSGTSEVRIIGGGALASVNKLYHRDLAVTDLSAAIAMTWESADWDLGEPETEKQAIGFTLYAKGTTSAQVLVVTNYKDGKSTAQTTGNRTMATTFAEYWCPQSGRGRQYSFRVYNTDSLGAVEFIPLTFEYFPLGGLRRLQR